MSNRSEKSNGSGAFLIDISQNTIRCDEDLNDQCLSDDQPIISPYNNGRWTQHEHLVFLAWIIHFGKDWKKIEQHVKTRSSAQARSHAQKVLRKMDKASILRETLRLKAKLEFKPEKHGLSNLTVLLPEPEGSEAALAVFRASKRNRGASKNRREKKLAMKQHSSERENEWVFGWVLW